MKKEYKYHYTYRITNRVEKKYYYGVHSCNCLPKEDIGVKYFSSTTLEGFVKDQKANPQNYKYKVIKIFETRIEAVTHEIFLHKKFNVKMHNLFYNASNQTSTGFDAGGNMTPEHKENLVKANLGNKYNLGRKHSPEVNAKKASKGEKNGMFGKKHPLERIDKISKNISKSKQIKCICEYCSKESDKGNYGRWHGENCKMNPNVTEEQLKKREPWNKTKI